MLEIAGGILIVLLILAALPYILALAYWGIAAAIGLAIVVVSWFALATMVGEGWAWGISITAFFVWLYWYEKEGIDQPDPEKKAEKPHKIFGKKGC